jgi:thiol-disulfide isomerase/thioredoxin
MVLEEVMRVAIVLVLGVALIAGGCDRANDAPVQANAATASADEVSPDEAPAQDAHAGMGGMGHSMPPVDTSPPRAEPKGGDFDRSHQGQAAPSYAFQTPDGKTTTLAAFRGKPTLVNIWATWCAPCVKEMPTLETLATREAGKLNVITISQDTNARSVFPWFAGRGFKALKPYTDAKMAWVPAVTSTLPTTVVYDSNGREAFRLVGELNWAGDFAAKALAAVK